MATLNCRSAHSSRNCAGYCRSRQPWPHKLLTRLCVVQNQKGQVTLIGLPEPPPLADWACGGATSKSDCPVHCQPGTRCVPSGSRSFPSCVSDVFTIIDVITNFPPTFPFKIMSSSSEIGPSDLAAAAAGRSSSDGEEASLNLTSGSSTRSDAASALESDLPDGARDGSGGALASTAKGTFANACAICGYRRRFARDGHNALSCEANVRECTASPHVPAQFRTALCTCSLRNRKTCALEKQYVIGPPEL